jgi:hypothetical protein
MSNYLGGDPYGQDSIKVGLIIFALALAVLFIAFALKGENPNEVYKKACVENHGKPVHNGRNWECLK